MGNNDFLYKQEKDQLNLSWKAVVTGNKNYLIYNDENGAVNIFSLKSNRNIKLDSHSSIIKMHPKYVNIFILAEGDTARLFEIDKNNFVCKEKSKIRGYSNKIKIKYLQLIFQI